MKWDKCFFLKISILLDASEISLSWCFLVGETSKIFNVCSDFWGFVIRFDLRMFFNWVETQAPTRHTFLLGGIKVDANVASKSVWGIFPSKMQKVWEPVMFFQPVHLLMFQTSKRTSWTWWSSWLIFSFFFVFWNHKLMIHCWFGLVVWIPGFPLMRGIVT